MTEETTTTEVKLCANPQCGHREIVHRNRSGRCESLNTVLPCSCEKFEEPK